MAEAADLMKMTSGHLLENHVIDRVFKEPKEGLEHNLTYTTDQLKAALRETIPELMNQKTEELLENRYQRFRKFGEFTE